MARHSRDEYKWMNDILAGQNGVRRDSAPKRKSFWTLGRVATLMAWAVGLASIYRAASVLLGV